jgi:hypothetical protein
MIVAVIKKKLRTDLCRSVAGVVEVQCYCKPGERSVACKSVGVGKSEVKTLALTHRAAEKSQSHKVRLLTVEHVGFAAAAPSPSLVDSAAVPLKVSGSQQQP